MHNLYYPIYKNLENEVTNLAYKIHFTDDQLDVYSIIAPLFKHSNVYLQKQ